MAAPGPPTAGAVLALGSGTNAAIPVPASVAVNDVIVVLLYLEANRTVSGPGDFTPLSGNPNATAQQWEYVFVKRATAADSGTYTFTWTTAAPRKGVAIRIPGALITGDPVDAFNRAARSTNGTVTPSVTLTTTGAERLLLWLGTNFQAGTWTPPSGYTELVDSGEITVAYREQAAAGSTGSVTGTGSNSGQQTATLLALTPANTAVDHTRTVSDIIGITDTATRTSAASRTVGDTIGVTDATTAGVGHSRTVSDSVGITDAVTFTNGQEHIRTVADTIGITDATTRQVAIARTVSDTVGITDLVMPARTVAPLNVSLWAVTSGDVLAPLPVFEALEVSRERNGVGSVSVDYPAAGAGFGHLKAARTGDKPVEVEVWFGGSRDGALRALLSQEAGDELDGRAVWRLSGTFLEIILADGIVYPQPAPAEKGELRFDAKNTGQIVLTVLQQAQARGALTGVTRDWTTSVDSSGQVWPSTVSGLKYSPGASLLDILQDLVDKDLVEFELTRDRVLRIWAPGRRGVDRTGGTDPTLFRYGRVTSAPVRHTTRDTVTAVLAVGADGLSATASDASAEARIGRRIEVKVDANNIDNQGALNAFAQAALATLTSGQEEIRHPLTFGPGDPRPKAGYDLADRVLSERAGGVRRAVDVQQWTLTAARQRVTGGEVVLNDLIASRLQRLARQVQRISSGAAVVGTSDPPEDRGLAPAAPTGVTVDSEAYQDAGTTQAALTVSWAPVTTNVDGSGTDDVAGYRVQWRLENAVAWQQGADTPNPPVSFGDVAAGADIRVRVAAYDRDGNQSAWSAEVALTTEDDITAPEAPSTPTAEPYLGQIRVAYDGRDYVGAPMAPDTEVVELHASTAAVFTPDATTAKEVFVPNIAGERVLTDLPYGVTIYVRLVAVDRTGNRSTPSGTASATPSKVVGDDVFDGAIGTAKLADLAVTTAKIGLLQVNDAQIGSASFGKLTAGNITAIGTFQGGEIRTAASGQRMRMGNDGLEAFLADGTTKFFDLDIATQTLTVVGTYRSGFSGERINILPDGTMRIYGASGTDYGEMANDGGVWRMSSRAGTGGRRSFVDFDPTGLNVTYGNIGGAVRSGLNCGMTYAVLRGPVTGIRVMQGISPDDGTENRFHFVVSSTATSSGDLGNSVIHYQARDSDDIGGMVGPGRSGLLWANGAIGVIGGTINSGNGPIVASAFNPPSSELVKTAAVPTRFGHDGALTPGDVLDAVPAPSWSYTFDDRRLRHVGPIAEHLQAVDPDLVVVDYEGRLATDLRDLVGVTWGAERETRADLREARAEIRDLRERLDRMEGRSTPTIVEGEIR